MASPRSQSIKRIFGRDGKIIHQGKASSLKALVEHCTKNAISLKGADLQGLDLTHLDLRNGDFTEACLDRARLTGSKLNNAVFKAASMRGISAAGVDAVSANFQDVDFSPFKVQTDANLSAEGRHKDEVIKSSFVDAILTYARFEGSNQVKVNFSGAGMSSTTHIGAVCHKSNYTAAHLHNADWSEAKIVGNTFDRADMSPRMNISDEHLPDRTRNAVIVGNSYDGTRIGSGNSGFLQDSYVVKRLKLATIGLVTSGLFVATAAIPFDIENVLTSTIGKTATFILAASALTWIKAPLEDMVKEKAVSILASSAVHVRSAISEMWRRGKAIASLSVALMTKNHADQVERILQGRHGGFFERIKAAARGDFEVIVCDREQLSEALSRLSEMMTNRTGHKHSVILVRMGEADKAVPRAIVVNSDSGFEALWDEDSAGYIKHRAWDPAKIPLGDPDLIGPKKFTMAPSNSHLRVISKFTDAILAEHGLDDLNIRHSTHLVRRGKDGSIVVVQQKDGRLDNAGSPAVITPSDERLYFRNSNAYDATGKRMASIRP